MKMRPFHDFLIWGYVTLQAIAGLATPTKPNINNMTGKHNDPNMVNTPAGPMHREHIHALPSGALIRQSTTSGPTEVVAANGTLIQTLHTTSSSITRRDFQWGYAAYSFWGNTAPDAAPIALFTTSWTVPPIPATGHGSQTIFLFNALEPGSGVSRILQPVLQYGTSDAGSGDFWSVASWWVNDGESFFTPLVKVSPGQSLEGILTLTSVTTSANGTKTYGYNSVFAGIPASSMSISSPVELTFAYEALEIYRVNNTSDLPPGRTEMRGINIVDNNGLRPPVTWTAFADADEGFGAVVMRDGPINGEVDLVYPSQK